MIERIRTSWRIFASARPGLRFRERYRLRQSRGRGRSGFSTPLACCLSPEARFSSSSAPSSGGCPSWGLPAPAFPRRRRTPGRRCVPTSPSASPPCGPTTASGPPRRPLEQVAVHGGDIPLPRPLHHRPLVLPARPGDAQLVVFGTVVSALALAELLGPAVGKAGPCSTGESTWSPPAPPR
jgi:hypothetical protein